MKINKVLRFVWLIGLLAGYSSCSKTTEKDDYVEEVYTFERIKSVSQEGFFMLPGEERTIDIDFESLDSNYLKLLIQTDVNVYGTFNYVNIYNSEETGRESFYVPKDENEQ